jgi:hypothetical protein
MSRSDDASGVEWGESAFREYVLDVRITEHVSSTGEGPRYRFEAPHHDGISFDDPALAELYAAVYFDVNGFQEGSRGARSKAARNRFVP